MPGRGIEPLSGFDLRRATNGRRLDITPVHTCAILHSFFRWIATQFSLTSGGSAHELSGSPRRQDMVHILDFTLERAELRTTRLLFNPGVTNESICTCRTTSMDASLVESRR